MQHYLLGKTSGVISSIVDAPPLPAADRLAIYRNAYQVRLIDALHETYPVLHSLLGDEVWVEMGEAFVAEYPSKFRSIRWYGRQMAQFLAEREPFSDAPILAEVALLEWTLSEVFDSPDAEPLQRAALSAWGLPSEWASLTFEFHPSLRRLEIQLEHRRGLESDECSMTRPPPPELAAGAAAVAAVARRTCRTIFDR